jgi:hypothetical protein
VPNGPELIGCNVYVGLEIFLEGYGSRHGLGFLCCCNGETEVFWLHKLPLMLDSKFQ